MCGIIGVASTSPNEYCNWIVAGSDTMAHRGPDDAGIWHSNDRRVALGHRRLAIVDLSSAGHQPMHYPDGSLTVVFNGEIYNFCDLKQELISKGESFHSHCDTEVVLAAYRQWGNRCLERLNGMFAFALYDARKEQLLLARDRAGEKPLFYRLADGSLRFASELKGLLIDQALPRRIDPQALDLFLSLGYVPGENCLIKGFNKLPPGHALEFDLRRGTSEIWCYWKLPEPPLSSAGPVEESVLLNELETLLEDAVSKQLVADVPVGVLLSGGVDSSLITALAVRACRSVKTFTVGFSGFSGYDESIHARLVARHFSTEHLELNAGEVTPNLLDSLAHQYDEPMADSSMIPTNLLSQLVRQHCSVALGGDGGDELFGGYSHYSRLLWLQRLSGSVPLTARKMLVRSIIPMMPYGFKGRNWLQSLACDLNDEVPQINVLFHPAARTALMSAIPSWRLIAEEYWRKHTPSSEDLLQRATRMDFQNYLAEDILVKIDRASMLNSLELRAPLLDYRIIEFAFGKIPSFLKVAHGERKILLKKLAERLLPPAFDKKRKQGFSIPLGHWLKSGPWRERFHEILLDTNSFFDRKTVQILLQSQDRGRNNSERLFALVLFELWRREYKISI